MAEANISRHELKIKHRRLVEHARQIKSDYEDTRTMLQDFYDSYIELYEYFPLFRYPKLKKLIKKFATKENIDNLRQKVQEASSVEAEGDSQIEDEETEGSEGRPLVAGGKPYGIVKQALRKVEKFCGLDDEPIEDEDVMTDESLRRHCSRMKRNIHFHHSEMSKTLGALDTLHDRYVRSKATYFPLRFFTLKKMVRELISVTKPDSKYKT